MRNPEINKVVERYEGKKGNPIFIESDHYLKFVEVKVITTRSNGKLIEKGMAPRRYGSMLWRYETMVKNNSLPDTIITVVARDRPGNVVSCRTSAISRQRSVDSRH